MKMRKITLIFALGLCLCSCGSFLDRYPTDSANAETAIASVNDARVALNGIMRKMSDKTYYGRDFFLYGDARGGDLTIISSGRGSDFLYTFNTSPSKYSCDDYWNTGYICLANINNLIDNILRLKEEGDTGYDQYLGEAYTLRAIVYFDLVRIYGLPYNYKKDSYGVPLVLDVADADSKPGRATVAEVYDQILADLAAGEALMTHTKVNSYPGYYAALAEEARVRLYKEDWTGALTCAKEIIDCGIYTLYTPAQWVQSWTTQYGSESIFEIGMDSASDIETNSLAFYYMAFGRVANASGWFLASDYFLNRLGEDPDDVRWGVMDEDEFSSKGNGTHNGACYKYSGSVDLEGDGNETFTAVNIKVIRLSEIYLIAAEAALELGQKAKAAEYLNAIRARSVSLEPATASTVSIDMIMSERSKEFFGEGQLFFERIRRNESIEYNDDLAGIAVSTRPKTIDRTFGKIVLPIDQNEINANPTLKDQQNEAYK